jgi:hypothetical protein
MRRIERWPSTYGDLLDAATRCQTSEEAEVLVNLEVRRLTQTQNLTETKARDITLHNIGYMSGYLSQPERHRLCALFHTTHSIFGDSDPTLEEAFALGQKFAADHLKSKPKPEG